MKPSSGAGGNVPSSKVQGPGINNDPNAVNGTDSTDATPQASQARLTKVNRDPSLISPAAAQGAYTRASLQVAPPINIHDVIAKAIQNPTLSSGVLSGLHSAGSTYNGEPEFPAELVDAGFSTQTMRAFNLASGQA